MFGVIDIGSNSVRLMLTDGNKTIKKFCQITKLAEGLGQSKLLSDVAINRTAEAVSFYFNESIRLGSKRTLAFATAAVREAKNGNIFCEKVKSLCGLNVDVISGEVEAELGATGCLQNNDGGIIDIGGASTEITIKKDNKLIFKKSVPIGVVKIRDYEKLGYTSKNEIISKNIVSFSNVPFTDFYCIGGTATIFSAIIQELSPYDPEKVDGFVIEKQELLLFINRLSTMSISEIEKLKGIQKGRADVILGGAMMLYELFNYIGIDRAIVSEKDNLEGFFIKFKDRFIL